MKSDIIRIAYKKGLKPILFKIDPEKVHDTFVKAGHSLGKRSFTEKLLRRMFVFEHDSLRQNIDGVDYPNPVGLSAGFDKDADLLPAVSSIGFGFTQVGSVTLKPYEGNPKPRLYRLPKSKGIVVYYGLKNIGAEKVIEKIKKYGQIDISYSVSIAKTNDKCTVETKDAVADYVGSLRSFANAGLGDMYTINISCPNTFGGEPFTEPEKLHALLGETDKLRIDKPVYIKMPINLEWREFDELLQAILKHKVNGVIIGNLQKDRSVDTIKDPIPEEIKGGISGLPTQKASNELIYETYARYKDELTIIGVGGIFSANDAYEKIKLGASLVQLITGMIFEGPQVIGDINRGLVEFMEKDGLTNISQAVGLYHARHSATSRP